MNNTAVTRTGLWNDRLLLSSALRAAKELSRSEMIPEEYRGSIGSCLLAIDLSARLDLSPLTVMQCGTVIHGRFCWLGTACKAIIDRSGRYERTEYVTVGLPGSDSHGVFLRGICSDGTVEDGPAVTIGRAKSEGWLRRPGSRWRTMPEIMLRYRAAAYFGRVVCPALFLGFHTDDELEERLNLIPEGEKTSFTLPQSGEAVS